MGQNRILTVDSAINFALNTVSPEKIAPLFAKFGYKPEEISVQAAIDLWNEYGDEFIVPFAAMAKEVLTDADQMADLAGLQILFKFRHVFLHMALLTIY